MKTIKEWFSRQKHIEKFFIFLCPASFAVWLYLAGYLSGRVDDWAYNGLLLGRGEIDAVDAVFYLSFIFPFVPAFSRFCLAAARELLSRPATVAEITIVASILLVGFAISMPQFCAMTSGEGGFSAGGAKDIENFRRNIQRGFMPQETDITCEGLFYDYYFDTIGRIAAGEKEIEKSLFKPVYSWVSSKNPLSGETENYLAIGLRAGRCLTGEKRKKLNLAIVLDISGSMSASFNRYYYDGNGGEKTGGENEGKSLSKLALACRSINGLLERLRPDDRLAIALFDHRAYVAKPLRKISATNLDALKIHMLSLSTGGGTDMESGYSLGRRLLEGFENSDPREYENRIILLTDAMPNRGNTSGSGLLAAAEEYARAGIHTTFIGIGVDFNTRLINEISRVRGANYYSVHSSSEFRRRMELEFDYMVNPLVFDLRLSFESKRWKISGIYGSPEADLCSGELMRVNTLFPAPVSDNGVKGGIIVVKLADRGEGDGSIKLEASYETREGKEESCCATVSPPLDGPETAAEKDALKAVLLARYAEVMKAWINRETRREGSTGKNAGSFGPSISSHERGSRELMVSAESRSEIASFADYFKAQLSKIDDAGLERELKIMNLLAEEKEYMMKKN